MTTFPIAMASDKPFYLIDKNKLPPRTSDPTSQKYVPGSSLYADWLVKRTYLVAAKLSECFNELEKYNNPKTKQEEIERDWVLVKIKKKTEYIKFLNDKFELVVGDSMISSGYAFSFIPASREIARIESPVGDQPNSSPAGVIVVKSEKDSDSELDQTKGKEDTDKESIVQKAMDDSLALGKQEKLAPISGVVPFVGPLAPPAPPVILSDAPAPVVVTAPIPTETPSPAPKSEDSPTVEIKAAAKDIEVKETVKPVVVAETPKPKVPKEKHVAKAKKQKFNSFSAIEPGTENDPVLTSPDQEIVGSKDVPLTAPIGEWPESKVVKSEDLSVSIKNTESSPSPTPSPATSLSISGAAVSFAPTEDKHQEKSGLTISAPAVVFNSDKEEKKSEKKDQGISVSGAAISFSPSEKVTQKSTTPGGVSVTEASISFSPSEKVTQKSTTPGGVSVSGAGISFSPPAEVRKESPKTESSPAPLTVSNAAISFSPAVEDKKEEKTPLTVQSAKIVMPTAETSPTVSASPSPSSTPLPSPSPIPSQTVSPSPTPTVPELHPAMDIPPTAPIAGIIENHKQSNDAIIKELKEKEFKEELEKEKQEFNELMKSKEKENQKLKYIEPTVKKEETKTEVKESPKVEPKVDSAAPTRIMEEGDIQEANGPTF
jgi:hypothetical protein